MKFVSLILLSIVLFGCVSSGNTDKLKSLYVKKDTPLQQRTSDISSCRERVTSGEFQETYNTNQVAIGGDPLAKAFAKGYAEGRLRARLTFFCLETEGYERLMVPGGTYKRIEVLSNEEQIKEVNKLLAEQPRGKSMKEVLFSEGS